MLVRGMVSADGNTYRVSRVSDDVYEVVRIIDDHRIGTFETSPTLRVIPEGVEETLLREIAHLTMKQGKISSVRPAPLL